MRVTSTIVLFALVIPARPLFAEDWHALLSPGPVADDHLATESDCDGCHLVFKGVPNTKCLRCHVELKTRSQKNVGFHAGVKKDLCIKCHQDHRGRDSELTKPEAKSQFDHRLTGVELQGAHQNLRCESCHKEPVGKMPAKCGGCHKDPHQSELGSACQSCHDSVGWKHDLKELTAHQVRTDGGHQGLACKDCHAQGRHLEKTVGCESCHEQSHGGTKAACTSCHSVSGFKPAKFDHAGCTCTFPGKHRNFSCLACHPGFKFTATPLLCSGCHQKDLKHDALGECSLCHSPLSWKDNVFDHNKKSKFHLADTHLTVHCGRCHQQTKGNKTLFREAPTECKGCHEKQGIEAHGDFGDCARCHTTKGFAGSTFDHRSTGFAIGGRHQGIKCQDCHQGKVRGFPKRTVGALRRLESPPNTPLLAMSDLGLIASLLFAQTGGQEPAAPPHGDAAEFACGHCHDDPHQGQAGSKCESCHGTADWVPSTFDLSRHAGTKFPLQGKHVEVACTECHVESQLKGLPLECAGCHVDPHQGKFGQSCRDCHNEKGFSPVEGFDHNRTGFELSGAHSQQKCEACHQGDRAKKMDQAKDKQACQTCHQPRHASDLGPSCSGCHLPDDLGFGAAKHRFDHRATGFVLERRHLAVKCGACHPSSGKKPAKSCGGCHLDPHAGQLTNDCGSCHRPDRFSVSKFDHDRAGWPLRGRHFVTPCVRCHATQRWVGVSTDCWDCHALDAARARTKVPGAHPFGRLDCTDCHFSGWTWR